MLPERSRIGWRYKRIVLLMTLLSVLSVAASSQLVQVTLAGDPAGEVSLSKMNFHMHSLVYGNSNSSIFIYSDADANPPTYATPVTSLISCKVRQSGQIWFGQTYVWLGGVSWVTQPLTEDLRIQGNVSVTVWMSTPDQRPLASGYAFGLSEADGMGNPVGEEFYQYYYGEGSVLGLSPTPIRLSFNVNQNFTKGNILSFFVIAGSTSEGWRYQVYFDSPNMNSFAELPILSAPVPEFSQAGAAISMTLALFSLLAMRRKVL